MVTEQGIKNKPQVGGMVLWSEPTSINIGVVKSVNDKTLKLTLWASEPGEPKWDYDVDLQSKQGQYFLGMMEFFNTKEEKNAFVSKIVNHMKNVVLPKKEKDLDNFKLEIKEFETYIVD